MTQSIMLFFILLASLVSVECIDGIGRFEEVFAWKRFTFEDKGLAGQNGSFFEIPMGLDIYDDKLFLGFPRRSNASPIGLGYIDLSLEDDKSPDVIPYPSIDYHDQKLKSAGKIISVFRPRVDSCNRLWFVDIGIQYNKGIGTVVQQPSLIIIDLEADKVVKNYTLKNGRDILYNNPGGLVNIAVDIIGNDCQNAFGYIPDIYHSGLIVYSLKDDDSWRVKHNFMALDPEEGDFNLEGLEFQFSDGIFSVALGPTQANSNYRTAYFHAFASHRERAVSTEVFRNKTLATRRFHGNDFWVVGNRGKRGNSNAHAIDKTTGVMFSVQAGLNAVSCWNIKNTPLSNKTLEIIAKDNDIFLYPSDLKIDRDRMVWVLVNRFPFFYYSTLNPDKYNFRILRVPVDDAIAGTSCDVRRRCK